MFEFSIILLLLGPKPKFGPYFCVSLFFSLLIDLAATMAVQWPEPVVPMLD
jgi:hypothetical protein